MTTELAWQIGDTAHALRRTFDRRAADAGITRAQWRVLALLKHWPESKQVAIADRLDVEPITLCRIIDRLEEAGLVERLRDPTDRRAWRLRLTDRAEPLLAGMTVTADAVADEAFAGLSDEERSKLMAMLTRVRTNLAALDEEGRKSA